MRNCLATLRYSHAVHALPDRITVGVVAACFALVVVLHLGVWSPPVALLAALAAAAAIQLSAPAPAPATRQGVIAARVALLFSAVWVAANWAYVSQRVMLTRDPDVYALAARWLIDHPSTDIPQVIPDQSWIGMHAVDGVHQPQGASLIPAVGAIQGWLLGADRVDTAAPLMMAAALLAVYAVGTRVVGPVWALVGQALLGLTVSAVMLGRSLYSEPLMLVMTAAGALYLVSAVQTGRRRDLVLAGACLGSGALARIDGALLVAGVPLAVAMAATLRNATATLPRSGPAWVLAGALPPMLLGWVDLRRFSEVYLSDLARQYTQLTTVTLAGCAAGLVWAYFASRAPDRISAPNTRKLLRGSAWVVAVLWVALLSRPWWLPTPHLGRRPVWYEFSVQWMSLYLGWFAALIGLAMLCWALAASSLPRRGLILVLVALALPSTVLYLSYPSIYPDQPWASRRFFAVVTPALILAFLVAARFAWRAHPAGRALAVAAIGFTGYTALAGTAPMWDEVEQDGAAAGMAQACAVLGDGPVLVVGGGAALPPTVAVVCDLPVAYRGVDQPADVAAAARELAVATGVPTAEVRIVAGGPLPGVTSPGQPAASLAWLTWQRPVQVLPAGSDTKRAGLWLFSLRDDGQLAPVTA